MKPFNLGKFKSRQSGTKIEHVVEDAQTYVIREGKRITITTLDNPNPPKTHMPKARAGEFVMFNYERTLAAAGRLRDAPLAVLIELAYRSFKAHRSVVPLGNVKLQSVGISHDAKVRALRHLEAVGMVSVEWRGGSRTPLITILY
jgi:hypothetical protein